MGLVDGDDNIKIIFRSEGHLCLPKRKYPAVNFAAALKRMLAGDFRCVLHLFSNVK